MLILHTLCKMNLCGNKGSAFFGAPCGALFLISENAYVGSFAATQFQLRKNHLPKNADDFSFVHLFISTL